MSRYSDAAADLVKARKIDPLRESIKTLSAHVNAALGKKDEAIQLLNAARAQAEVKTGWLLAVAEAYLVVDPNETLNMLEANSDIAKESVNVASFLRAFAAILLGLRNLADDNLTILRRSESSLAKENWDVTELKEFLKWGKTRGQLTEDQHLALSKLVSDSGWSEVGPEQQLLPLPRGDQELSETGKDQDTD